jgi:prepilin-type N-terminal cleavage/methylation domain-containing protein
MTNKIFKRKINAMIARVRGFTLMETLVAVLILSLSIVGPLTIASKGMQAALVAKDQTTAFFLAQDAVEYVRWVRDSNALYNSANPGSTVSWLAGLDGTANLHTNGGSSTGSCVSPNLCTIDAVKDAIAQCPSGTCSAISYDTTNYYFTYSSGTATIYNRSVQLVTPIGSNNSEAQIIVKVSWQDTVGPAHTITVYENLYQWQ